MHEHVREALVLAADRMTDRACAITPKLVERQVGSASIPSLCSSDAQQTSFLAPTVPSSFTRNFGTRKSRDAARALGCVRSRASTRWMTFSAMSSSPT